MTEADIRSPTRGALVAYLEGWSFQCYDHETEGDLRTAALENNSTEGDGPGPVKPAA